MGDEIVNSINLDLNLDFTDTVNRLNESLRQEQIDTQAIERLRQRNIYYARMANYDRQRERLIVQRDFRSIRHANRIRQMTENIPLRTWPRRMPEITGNITSELTNNLVVDPSSSFLSEEARVTPEERDSEFLKATKNNNNEVNIEEKGEKGNDDKGKDDDEKCSFFDCNICLDVAKDPIVTCCGHLFCWACVYQWLNLHSIANECPVCKGEVTMKNLTPIYGRGISTLGTERDPPGLKIPARPHAQRDHDADVAASRNAEVERERESLVPPFDDMDSLSTLAAVIRSESQSLDTTLEIDSDFHIATSTSRRRNEDNAPVISNVVRGDSRDHRRRRLN